MADRSPPAAASRITARPALPARLPPSFRLPSAPARVRHRRHCGPTEAELQDVLPGTARHGTAARGGTELRTGAELKRSSGPTPTSSPRGQTLAPPPPSMGETSSPGFPFPAPPDGRGQGAAAVSAGRGVRGCAGLRGLGAELSGSSGHPAAGNPPASGDGEPSRAEALCVPPPLYRKSNKSCVASPCAPGATARCRRSRATGVEACIQHGNAFFS